jgi:hypothetical protein
MKKKYTTHTKRQGYNPECAAIIVYIVTATQSVRYTHICTYKFIFHTVHTCVHIYNIHLYVLLYQQYNVPR